MGYEFTNQVLKSKKKSVYHKIHHLLDSNQNFIQQKAIIPIFHILINPDRTIQKSGLSDK